MLEVSTIHFSRLCKAVVEAGVDFVWIADDVAFKAGLFIPPKLFKEIWTKRMERIMEPALVQDIPVIFHSMEISMILFNTYRHGNKLLKSHGPICY